MNKDRLRLFILISSILLAMPLLAMEFTDEVVWERADFGVAAVLLFGTSILLELILSKLKNKGLRIAISAALVLALILIWTELAVGIFNSPIAGS
ncbi:MAG TPA: hypothetical protein DCS15_06925 [Flavobacteriales bacterium]|jgi:hypothetical protein|nr:hypothetical protein [Salibacteraceae bacterium]HAS36202.1 hypothetical protein [Flavobacteriales bacterium]